MWITKYSNNLNANRTQHTQPERIPVAPGSSTPAAKRVRLDSKTEFGELVCLPLANTTPNIRTPAFRRTMPESNITLSSVCVRWSRRGVRHLHRKHGDIIFVIDAVSHSLGVDMTWITLSNSNPAYDQLARILCALPCLLCAEQTVLSTVHITYSSHSFANPSHARRTSPRRTIANLSKCTSRQCALGIYAKGEAPEH